jgi:hypothetical protein
LAGEEGQPPTTEVMQEWCFAYGESDWVAYSTKTVSGVVVIEYGPTFDDAYFDSQPYDDEGNLRVASGQINCNTGEAISE